MLAYRLVRLIETHSERLAEGLLLKLQHCEKCRDFERVPGEEFRQRAYEIYHNLGDWLLGKKEEDIARRYREIGQRREAQGVPLSQLIWAITLTREHLWEYLKHEASADSPVEVFGELEMLQLLEQFFDRASYWAAAGFEEAQAARAGQGEKVVEHAMGR